ncbi:MAG: hypothetical protein HYT65_01375 [Candidatus Yanofskybacteria bacterium]|nr:hypothetical protein [Candidatus Yanofskybacteria bacterium]
MEPYQFTSGRNDIVRLPDGRLGVIKDWDIIWGGHFKEVIVHLLYASFWEKFFWFFLCRQRFYDDQINQLQKISTHRTGSILHLQAA